MNPTPSAPEEPAIVVRDLTRRFGDFVAVAGIDLTIRQGEIFGLLGPNGAGKTTTIKMLVTLLDPTGGEARVAGYDVATQPAKVRQSVGIVFQEPSLDSILTGRENLQLHGRLYGVPRKELAARVDEMLRLVDLEKRADDLVRTYSGGMKRRLEIARGLLHRPRIIFLDEPTLGLDPQTRERVWGHIRRLREETNTTFLLTTHYMEEADQLCDRIGIIDHGRIVALDTPRNLKASLGGDVVRLRAPADRASALEALPYVEGVDLQEDEIVLTVRNAAENLPEILKAAGEVRGVEIRSPTLEDVFIHHTGHEIRDTQENESYADAFFRHQQHGGGS